MSGKLFVYALPMHFVLVVNTCISYHKGTWSARYLWDFACSNDVVKSRFVMLTKKTDNTVFIFLILITTYLNSFPWLNFLWDFLNLSSKFASYSEFPWSTYTDHNISLNILERTLSYIYHIDYCFIIRFPFSTLKPIIFYRLNSVFFYQFWSTPTLNSKFKYFYFFIY